MNRKIITKVLAAFIALLFSYGGFSTSLQAQGAPTGTEAVLQSNFGEGFASFGVDEFGGIRGCGENGIDFTPLGPFPQRETDCATALHVFEVGGTGRHIMADNEWIDAAACNNKLPGEVAITIADLLTPAPPPSLDSWETWFDLPNFTNLSCSLRQEVCGNRLVQTYKFINGEPNDVTLRLTRVADLDLTYTSSFTRNWGAEYPLSPAVPTGATVYDRNQSIGVSIIAPPVGDAVFEGWRIRMGGFAAAAHRQATTEFGYNPANLNGIYQHAGSLCLGSDDIFKANNLADYITNGFNFSDVAAIIQSTLLVPANGNATYVTETLAQPGNNCCQGVVNCGTISGTVTICGATALFAEGQMIQATETTTGQTYYAITDVNGNYILNLPYGTYDVEILLGPTNTTTQPAIIYGVVVDASTPNIAGVDFCVDPNCSADLLIIGQWPAEVTPPGVCGIVPPNPCPLRPWRQCYTLINQGTSPLSAGITTFTINLPTGMTFDPANLFPLSACGIAGLIDPIPNNDAGNFFLLADLAPGASCEICLDIIVDLTLGATPQTTYSGFTECANGLQSSFAGGYDETKDCACDPNDMKVSPVGCGTDHAIELNQELTYTTRFQNVGTGPASLVIVRDTLDADLDMSSFRLFYTKHDLTKLQVNKLLGSPTRYELVFIFRGIDLPPEVSDAAGSIGYIVYKISPKAGLADGTLIENRAGIYFDSNPVVLTNTAFNTLRTDPEPIVDLGDDANVYMGYTVALECTTLVPTVSGGSGTYTYLWNTGATTPTLEVCPTDTTTYSVVITDVTGCEGVAEIQVNATDVTCQNGNGNGPHQPFTYLCHQTSPGNSMTICMPEHRVAQKLQQSGWSLGPCPPSGGAGNGGNKTHSFNGIQAAQANLEVFPNPFQNSTTFTFALETRGQVSLTVYDLSGNKVADLFQGVAEEGQEIRLDFDAEGLAAGLYFYKFIQEGAEMKMGKLVLQP